MPSELAVAASAALDLIHRAYSTGEWMKLPKEVGWEWVEGWDTDLDGPEELRLAVVKALQNREREVRKRPRPPSWRDLLDTLSLPNWLACMAERFRRGKAFRIRQILEQNPNGYLVDFNGKAYGCAPGAMELA